MKKIITGVILALFLLTSSVLGASQPAEEFKKTSGFPGTLPSGWSFSEERTNGYKIFVPESSDTIVGIVLIEDEEMQGLSAEQARGKFLSAMNLNSSQSANLVKYKASYGSYGAAKGAGIKIYNVTNQTKSYSDIEFITHKKKLYLLIVAHPSDQEEVTKIREQLLNSIF